MDRNGCQPPMTKRLVHTDALQTAPMSPWLQLGLGGPRLLLAYATPQYALTLSRH
jgi:hypothetical protein